MLTKQQILSREAVRAAIAMLIGIEPTEAEVSRVIEAVKQGRLVSSAVSELLGAAA